MDKEGLLKVWMNAWNPSLTKFMQKKFLNDFSDEFEKIITGMEEEKRWSSNQVVLAIKRNKELSNVIKYLERLPENEARTDVEKEQRERLIQEEQKKLKEYEEAYNPLYQEILRKISEPWVLSGRNRSKDYSVSVCVSCGSPLGSSRFCSCNKG